MSERSGIEIDYCPQCRGVWLDRGELDKIIERNVPNDFQTPSRPSSGAIPGQRDDRRHKDDDDYYREKRPGKRKGFLDDLFDF